MSGSKRRHEGVIIVDHRFSPGLTDETIYKTNTWSNAKMPIGSGQGMLEMATFSCSHCPNVVYIHPLRNRPRGYCRKCDHYVCDSCEAKRAMDGGMCKTYKQQCDELQELGFLKENSNG